VFTYVGLARLQGIRTSAKYIQHVLAGLRHYPVPADYVRYIHQRIIENNPQLREIASQLSGTPPFPKTKRTEAGMKGLLRSHIVPKLSARAPYFSIKAVRAELEAARCPLVPATLNSYLHELTQAHIIHDAGRGWYSSLANPFTLNRAPVSGLVQQLNTAFPLLDFSVWSTEQIASYGHHLLAKFVAFVHTDRDSMPSVFEFLRDKGFDAHLNPRGTAVSQFTVRERTVVVRPKVTTQSRALNLMDASECYRIFANLAGQGRISMASVLDYARERRPAALGFIKLIKAEFVKKTV